MISNHIALYDIKSKYIKTYDILYQIVKNILRYFMIYYQTKVYETNDITLSD